MKTRAPFFALVFILLFFVISPAQPTLAQEPTPTPVLSIPVEDVVDDSTGPQAPLEETGILTQTAAWFVAFLTIWQASGLMIAGIMERTVKPLIDGLAGQLSLTRPVRDMLIVLTVIGAALITVSQSNINLLKGDPLGIFAAVPAPGLLIFNTLLLAVGAFMGHEIWSFLDTTSRRAEAIAKAVEDNPIIALTAASGAQSSATSTAGGRDADSTASGHDTHSLRNSSVSAAPTPPPNQNVSAG